VQGPGRGGSCAALRRLGSGVDCRGCAWIEGEAADGLAQDARQRERGEGGLWSEPALAEKRASFSRSEAGFFRLGLFREILLKISVELGGNWKGKSVIPGEIRGIGARNFVAM
jgi:hypothetical protein